MKRQDAIKLIGKILVQGIDGFHKEKKEFYKDMSLAEIILQELEDEGLAPSLVFDGENSERKWEE